MKRKTLKFGRAPTVHMYSLKPTIIAYVCTWAQNRINNKTNDRDEQNQMFQMDSLRAIVAQSLYMYTTTIIQHPARPRSD